MKHPLQLLLALTCAASARPLRAQHTSPSRPATPAHTPARPTAHTPVPKPSALMAMDPAVSVGTLPNGLRYYIRHNATPTGRAELRLVVNAGSLLEDPDQLGMAHFVEHMAFNGTTHFKKNELIGYLQSIGMQFGADLNAHTNYDETTYELTVPTDSSALRTGLTILEDWAHGVQFDSNNVVAERKVITEEWRLRSGAGIRVQLAHDSLLYRGTPYPSRLPIGTVESIASTNPAALKRFYHDWYRPDLMTIVAVGDFDQAAMVRAVTQRFSGLVMPEHPRPRPVTVVNLPATPMVSLVQSPEIGAWSGGVLFHKSNPFPAGTYAAYRASRVENMLLGVLNQRLARLIQHPNTPVLSAAFGDDRLQRGAQIFQLSVTSSPHELDSAFTLSVAELARIARDGVTPGELDMQKRNLLRQADEAEAQATNMSSAALASQYMMNALRGNISLSPEQVKTLLHQYVPTVTATEVRDLARTIRADTAPFIIASTPLTMTAGVGDSLQAHAMQSALVNSVMAARNATLPPYDPQLADAPLVPNPPTPGTIKSTRMIGSTGVTEWMLSNGVRVLLKPIKGGDDKIYVAGVRPGGYAMADSASYASAVVAAQLLGAGGVGAYSNDALSARYSGVLASVGTYVSDYADGVTAQSGVRATDQVLMFQLIYLKFTAPRVDTAVFARWRTQAEHPTEIDEQQVLLSSFLRNGNAFGRPVWGPLADSVTVPQAVSFYRSRFDDASGFTFVISGAFTLDDIRPSVEQYIGGLPSTGRAVAIEDNGVRPRAGPIQHYLLNQNVDPQAKVITVFTLPDSATLANAATVNALSRALQQRLTYVLRQKMGGVYVVEVGGGVANAPYSRVQLQIVYTCDPKRISELNTALFAQLDTMRTKGPTDTELHDFKEAMQRANEVASARADSWVQWLSTYVSYGWPLDRVGTEDKLAAQVTADQVRDMAQRLFIDPNRIEVVTMPQRFYTPDSVPAPASGGAGR